MSADLHLSQRGFAHTDPVFCTYGCSARVYQSSSAEGPHIWLNVIPSPMLPPDAEDQAVACHLDLDAARQIRDNLTALIDHLDPPGDSGPVEPETPAPSEPTAADWEATGATPGRGVATPWLWDDGWVVVNERGWRVCWSTGTLSYESSHFASAREAWEFVVACQVAALGLTPSGDER